MTDLRELPLLHLRVVTREVETVDEVLTHADPSNPTFWSRRGDAIAAFGEAVLLSSGATGIGAEWRALTATADIDDPLLLPMMVTESR